jgi:hypothetical protein
MAKDMREVKRQGRKMSVQEHDNSIMRTYRASIGHKKTICLSLRDAVRDHKIEAWELDGEVYYAIVRN